ncbi:MAG: response regulator [Spirochaetia bacterium]
MSSIKRDEYSDIIETLENLEQSLIEFEDALEKGGEADSLIHISFRYAHNLKSTLAMAGKDRSSELIHTVENHFDLLRSGEADPTRELVDKTLDAIDLIKENLFRDAEITEEIDQLIDELGRLRETTAAEEAPAVKNAEAGVSVRKVGFSLSVEEREKAEELVAQGQKLFRIDKLIKTDIDRNTFETLPIYEDVAEAGTLIASRPDYDGIDTSHGETVLKILFASEEDKDELFYTIFDPFQEVTLSGESVPDAAAAPGKDGKLRILVVEDDFVTRHLEISLMRDFGECEVAVDGKEAVSAFELRTIEGRPYDLILLDIMIPEMDGHGVLKRIREFEDERGIREIDRTKVIIISGLRDMGNISRSFRGQTDSYIVKPITKKKIERELSRLGFR